jgi:hypothetical protein
MFKFESEQQFADMFQEQLVKGNERLIKYFDEIHDDTFFKREFPTEEHGVIDFITIEREIVENNEGYEGEELFIHKVNIYEFKNKPLNYHHLNQVMRYRHNFCQDYNNVSNYGNCDSIIDINCILIGTGIQKGDWLYTANEI